MTSPAAAPPRGNRHPWGSSAPAPTSFFAATGITDGELLQGVRFLEGNHCRTQSLVMRSHSGRIRYIDAEHSLDKLRLRPG